MWTSEGAEANRRGRCRRQNLLEVPTNARLRAQPGVEPRADARRFASVGVDSRIVVIGSAAPPRPWWRSSGRSRRANRRDALLRSGRWSNALAESSAEDRSSGERGEADPSEQRRVRWPRPLSAQCRFDHRPVERRPGNHRSDRQGAAGPEGRAHHFAHRAARAATWSTCRRSNTWAFRARSPATKNACG